MACLCKHPQKLNLLNLMRKTKVLKCSCAISILVLTSFGLSSASIAGGSMKSISRTGTNQNQNVYENELAATELKLLGKTYTNDPLSKRLQRLELLTFGSTQYGSPEERWHNIESFLQNKNSPSRHNSAHSNNISNSLNELEKYVFKKTNPALSTAKRLDKLETKLFGQPNVSLPTERRIARLERTLGLPDSSGEMAELPNQTLSPRIRGFNNSPYFKRIQPGMPNSFGFSFGLNGDDMDDPDLSQFEAQMNRMFNEMQRQMQDPMQEAPTYPMQPPIQKRSPGFNGPRWSPQPEGAKIPAYNDPNFI